MITPSTSFCMNFWSWALVVLGLGALILASIAGGSHGLLCSLDLLVDRAA